MHLIVDATEVEKSHQITEKVEAQLAAKYDPVGILIHVEPPEYKEDRIAYDPAVSGPCRVLQDKSTGKTPRQLGYRASMQYLNRSNMRFSIPRASPDRRGARGDLRQVFHRRSGFSTKD